MDGDTQQGTSNFTVMRRYLMALTELCILKYALCYINFIRILKNELLKKQTNRTPQLVTEPAWCPGGYWKMVFADVTS